jgi:hypothetical protein
MAITVTERAELEGQFLKIYDITATDDNDGGVAVETTFAPEEVGKILVLLVPLITAFYASQWRFRLTEVDDSSNLVVITLDRSSAVNSSSAQPQCRVVAFIPANSWRSV